ncbi:hypothetical protein DPMN_158622 [Dreissena polymorpha]|uniref:Uncharacterized protein n=1 Tax=Dreissena polymorpha TaxID=45954 RepID=A0A9D4IND3_DREPO|nr:hypothetical protein DPMN_158622 [Dreissena polymorpha]
MCRNEEVIAKGNFGWIDRIVIREVQYQFEVNRCRNEEILIKSNYGWLWSKWAGWGAPGWIMRPCIVEIDRIVIREVQYQLEVNQCRNEEVLVKGNFVWAWPMWEGRPRVGNGPCIVEIDRIVIRELQYQFEVNQCRNEEVISMWAVRPMIYCFVIREVQYQFEVNRCRNEEVIVKGNFGWVGSMWIDPIVIREVQYQFEVNRCRNEEVNFQGSSAYSVGEDSGQDGRTDRRQGFSKSVWITRKNATAMYQKAYASS